MADSQRPTTREKASTLAEASEVRCVGVQDNKLQALLRPSDSRETRGLWPRTRAPRGLWPRTRAPRRKARRKGEHYIERAVASSYAALGQSVLRPVVDPEPRAAATFSELLPARSCWGEDWQCSPPKPVGVAAPGRARLSEPVQPAPGPGSRQRAASLTRRQPPRLRDKADRIPWPAGHQQTPLRFYLAPQAIAATRRRHVAAREHRAGSSSEGRTRRPIGPPLCPRRREGAEAWLPCRQAGQAGS